MTMDNSELSEWRDADRVLDELLTLAPSQREPALAMMRLTAGIDKKVRQLLAAAEADGGMLDGPVEDLFELLDGASPTEFTFTGRRLGPFEVEEEIGRGGMSVVYGARRSDGQFEQKVALKLLIMANFSTGSISRFQQEQSILARLHHSNIATLIDGGISDDGIPWLAMERVEGEPIDQNCDSRKLNSREIVGLFLQVCDAVSYAHRNLIVHRDLKPDNVLVDSEARVRLLDFGIAKLLDETGTHATQTRVFTPSYGAPEQFTGEVVTTATDVYGMGGLLYRLLARQDAREQKVGSAPPNFEPPSPPSQAKNAAPGIDNDLDTIVLMALRPEPERRYASATEFGDDLTRWLKRHPVAAVPDSFFYRARKLVQRRRTLVTSAVILVISVLIGLGTTLWQAGRAREQKEIAVREAVQAEAITDFLVELFSFAEPDRSQGSTWTVREALDDGTRQLKAQLKDQPALRARLLTTIGDIYRRLGLFDEAGPLLDEAIEISGNANAAEIAITRLHRADLALNQFELDLAEQHITTVLEMEDDELDDPVLRVDALRALSEVRRAQGKFSEATELVDRALKVKLAPGVMPPGHIARLYAALADIALEAKDLDRAGEMYETALALTREVRTGDHTDLAGLLESIGVYYTKIGQLDQALDFQEQALRMRERLLGETHPDVAYSLNDVASVLRAMARFDDAEPLYRRAYEIKRSRLGEDHPATLNSLNSLAVLAYNRGQVDNAANILTEVVEKAKRVHGESHPRVAEFMVNLAAMRGKLGQFESAEQLLLEALDINRTSHDGPTADEGTNLIHIGNLHRTKGKLQLAEEYYNEALKVLASAVGERHPKYVATSANLAGIRFNQGRYEDAVNQYEQTFLVASDVFPKDHPSLMVIETRFAQSLVRAGAEVRSLKHATAAVDVASRLYGAGHSRLLEAQIALGAALLINGRLDESKAVFDEVQDRIDGGSDPATANTELQHWLAVLATTQRSTSQH